MPATHHNHRDAVTPTSSAKYFCPICPDVESDNHVAMAGDGISDAPALSEAQTMRALNAETK